MEKGTYTEKDGWLDEVWPLCWSQLCQQLRHWEPWHSIPSPDGWSTVLCDRLWRQKIFEGVRGEEAVEDGKVQVLWNGEEREGGFIEESDSSLDKEQAWCTWKLIKTLKIINSFGRGHENDFHFCFGNSWNRVIVEPPWF